MTGCPAHEAGVVGIGIRSGCPRLSLRFSASRDAQCVFDDPRIPGESWCRSAHITVTRAYQLVPTACGKVLRACNWSRRGSRQARRDHLRAAPGSRDHFLPPGVTNWSQRPRGRRSELVIGPNAARDRPVGTTYARLLPSWRRRPLRSAAQAPCSNGCRRQKAWTSTARQHTWAIGPTAGALGG